MEFKQKIINRKLKHLKNTWRVNSTLLNNTLIKEKKISTEIFKYFKLNEYENTTQQNLQAAAKAVLKEKFIAFDTYMKNKSKQLSKLPSLKKKAN